MCTAEALANASLHNVSSFCDDFVHVAVPSVGLMPWWLEVVSVDLKAVVSMAVFGFDLKFSTTAAKPNAVVNFMKVCLSLGLIVMALNAYVQDLLKVFNLFEAPFSLWQKLLGVFVVFVTSPNFVAARAIWNSLNLQSPMAALGLRPKYDCIEFLGPMAFPRLLGGAPWLPKVKQIYALLLLPYVLPSGLVSGFLMIPVLVMSCLAVVVLIILAASGILANLGKIAIWTFLGDISLFLLACFCYECAFISAFLYSLSLGACRSFRESCDKSTFHGKPLFNCALCEGLQEDVRRNMAEQDIDDVDETTAGLQMCTPCIVTVLRVVNNLVVNLGLKSQDGAWRPLREMVQRARGFGMPEPVELQPEERTALIVAFEAAYGSPTITQGKGEPAELYKHLPSGTVDWSAAGTAQQLATVRVTIVLQTIVSLSDTVLCQLCGIVLARMLAGEASTAAVITVFERGSAAFFASVHAAIRTDFGKLHRLGSFLYTLWSWI